MMSIYVRDATLDYKRSTPQKSKIINVYLNRNNQALKYIQLTIHSVGRKIQDQQTHQHIFFPPFPLMNRNWPLCYHRLLSISDNSLFSVCHLVVRKALAFTGTWQRRQKYCRFLKSIGCVASGFRKFENTKVNREERRRDFVLGVILTKVCHYESLNAINYSNKFNQHSLLSYIQNI